MLNIEQYLDDALGNPGKLLVVPEWEGIPTTAFGGFVAASMLVTAARQTDFERPLSLHVRFHRPVPVAVPVELGVESERRGRQTETLAVRVENNGKLLATATASFGADGYRGLESQSAPPMEPLRDAIPVWKHLEELGLPTGAMMKRIGFRTASTEEERERDAAHGWHLRSDWPDPGSNSLVIRAAAATMAIDSFVSPAAMRANQVDMDQPWPVAMPSLDLAAWFLAPEAEVPINADGEKWLSVRVAVPVTQAGYALGRIQVWAGPALAAEGMSQVTLVPMPPS